MKIGELANNTKRFNDCWIWQGAPISDGYGRITIKGKQVRVHRLMYEISHSTKIPPGMVVCHTCDTPLCCNPDHLFLGTPKDNHYDAMEKGRHTRGEKVNTCKLSERQVIEIRKRWELAPKQYGMLSALAREFNVTHANIKCIISMKTWKHVTHG